MSGGARARAVLEARRSLASGAARLAPKNTSLEPGLLVLISYAFCYQKICDKCLAYAFWRSRIGLRICLLSRARVCARRAFSDLCHGCTLIPVVYGEREEAHLLSNFASRLRTKESWHATQSLRQLQYHCGWPRSSSKGGRRERRLRATTGLRRSMRHRLSLGFGRRRLLVQARSGERRSVKLVFTQTAVSLALVCPTGMKNCAGTRCAQLNRIRLMHHSHATPAASHSLLMAIGETADIRERASWDVIREAAPLTAATTRLRRCCSAGSDCARSSCDSSSQRMSKRATKRRLSGTLTYSEAVAR